MKEVKLFLDHGAIVDQQDYSGKHAFVFATLWGHQKLARLLSHHLWFKQKGDIGKAGQNYEQYTNEQRKEVEREEETLKTIKQANAELAYKEWHVKNNLVYSPCAYGQAEYDKRPNESQRSQSKFSNESIIKTNLKLRSSKQQSVRPNELFHKTNDRTVTFLKLSDFYKS